jgi:hypothetical protein
VRVMLRGCEAPSSDRKRGYGLYSRLLGRAIDPARDTLPWEVTSEPGDVPRAVPETAIRSSLIERRAIYHRDRKERVSTQRR